MTQKTRLLHLKVRNDGHDAKTRLLHLKACNDDKDNIMSFMRYNQSGISWHLPLNKQ
ncbi:MAG TPA: hypothetical protein QKA08_02715 [Candidatus Megaira endosymbiont of Nemacystus decipiens]|nr:hypothetical protein [Candidatus Megaera endosymbiont of Nemacystus decipiens]